MSTIPESSLLKLPAMVVQLKQSLLSLHAITSPPPAAVGGDSAAVAAAAAAGNALDAVMSTNAVAQTKILVEQLQQQEAALQQRLAEIDAVQQYQQVQPSILETHANCVAVLAYPGCTFCMVGIYICTRVFLLLLLHRGHVCAAE